MEHRSGLNAHKHYLAGLEPMLVPILRTVIIRFLVKKVSEHGAGMIERFLERKLVGFADKHMYDAIKEEDDFNDGLQRNVVQARRERQERKRARRSGFDIDAFLKGVDNDDSKH